MSFIAKYWSMDGKTLVGGVVSSQSSRWSHREDAELYLQGVIEVNGADRCAGEVVESRLRPQIVRHCPGVKNPVAQAVGCICPHCKEVV